MSEVESAAIRDAGEKNAHSPKKSDDANNNDEHQNHHETPAKVNNNASNNSPASHYNSPMILPSPSGQQQPQYPPHFGAMQMMPAPYYFFNPNYHHPMYWNHQHTPVGPYTDLSNQQDPDPNSRRNRGGVTDPFPDKLHRMLDYAEHHNLTDVVTWCTHGRAFIVKDSTKFAELILPQFFRQKKYTSFQRQLNLYGFRRKTKGVDSGAYYHECFLRGRPKLSSTMRRTKIKGGDNLRATAPDHEPNFYSFPPVNMNPLLPAETDETRHPEQSSPQRKTLAQLLPYGPNPYAAAIAGGDTTSRLPHPPMMMYPQPFFNVVGPYTMAQREDESEDEQEEPLVEANNSPSQQDRHQPQNDVLLEGKKLKEHGAGEGVQEHKQQEEQPSAPAAQDQTPTPPSPGKGLMNSPAPPPADVAVPEVSSPGKAQASSPDKTTTTSRRRRRGNKEKRPTSDHVDV